MKTKKLMTDSLTVRLDHDLKVDAEEILSSLGLKSADAVRTFYKQIVLQKGLPYDLKVPNTETRFAMIETDEMINSLKSGDDIGGYSSVDDMFSDM